MTTPYTNKWRPYTWDTPLIIAVDRENLDLVKILLGAHIDRDCPDILDFLLAAKPNVNAVDIRNNKPLMADCLSRNEESMLMLLENGRKDTA